MEKVNREGLEIDWDSNENLETVRDTITILLKGCSCRTGYSFKRCSSCKVGRSVVLATATVLMF